MMINRKILLILLLVTASLTLLSGCFRSTLPENCGELAITVLQPAEIAPQYVEQQLVISEYFFTIYKEGITYRESFEAGERIIFRELEAGVWNINVEVKDVDGIIVATGSGTGTVSASTTTPATISLEYVKSQLEVVFYTLNNDVKRARVSLIDPSQNDVVLVQEEQIESYPSYLFVTFTDLQPTTWPLKVELMNATGEVIGCGTGYVDILPGRTVRANISMAESNGLQIDLTWLYPPAPPQRVSAYRGEDGVGIIQWDANIESNIAGYLIYRSESETGKKKLLIKLVNTETTYTDNNVDETKVYYYWVQAYNNIGYSSNLSEAGILELPKNFRILYQLNPLPYGANKVCIIDADGTDEVILTEEQSDNLYPDISPDGSKVVYTYIAPSGWTNLCIMNVDGTEKTLIANVNYNFPYHPKWSPDGMKITFWADSGGRIYDIYTINADGTNPVNVTKNDYRYDARYPMWSPDGSKILYYHFNSSSDYSDLYVINADGTNKFCVADEYHTYSADWSPTGEEIVYISNTDPALSDVGYEFSKLYLINVDGTNKRQLYRSYADCLNSCDWSPDGTRIVFTNYKMLMVQGINETEPTEFVSLAKEPHWTPDSSMIVFSYMFYVGYDIARIDDNGQMLTRLTFTGDENKWEPSNIVVF